MKKMTMMTLADDRCCRGITSNEHLETTQGASQMLAPVHHCAGRWTLCNREERHLRTGAQL